MWSFFKLSGLFYGPGSSTFPFGLGGWIGGKMVEYNHMGVEPKIGGKPPKSWILIGFSIIYHPFWGTTIFGNTHNRFFCVFCIYIYIYMVCIQYMILWPYMTGVISYDFCVHWFFFGESTTLCSSERFISANFEDSKNSVTDEAIRSDLNFQLPRRAKASTKLLPAPPHFATRKVRRVIWMWVKSLLPVKLVSRVP